MRKTDEKGNNIFLRVNLKERGHFGDTRRCENNMKNNLNGTVDDMMSTLVKGVPVINPSHYNGGDQLI
jgi:hypothetical protein